MSSQKTAKRASSPLAAATEEKKQKHTPSDVSCLDGCADVADIFFNVRQENNDVVTFPAHMKKFETLTNGSVLRVMAENLAGKPENVDLPDYITPTGFLAVLRFLYGKPVRVTARNKLDILAAARYCMIEDLKEALEFDEDDISTNAALKGLAFCHNHGVHGTSLEQKCWEYFDDSAEGGFMSPEFFNVDVTLLAKILKRDSLEVRDESVVWNAACDWAKHQLKRAEHAVTDESIREQLRNALFHVRFGEMTPQQFGSGPNKTGVLTDKERLSVWSRLFDHWEDEYKFAVGSRRDKVKSEVEYLHVTQELYLRVDADPWSTAACRPESTEFRRKHAYRCICGRVNENDGYLPEDKPYACIYCGTPSFVSHQFHILFVVKSVATPHSTYSSATFVIKH